jgi:hypothetical protein
MRNSKLSSAVTTFPGDLTAKPKNWLLTERVPRNFLSMPFWTQQSTLVTQFVTANNNYFEFNISFLLSLFTSVTALTTVFDQYCFESVTVSVTPKNNALGFEVYGFMITAIDYDSVAPLGLASSLEQYSTALVTELISGQSIQRALHPTVAPAIYNSVGSGFSGYGVARMWVDAANVNVPHYGFRSAYSNPAGINNPIELDYTIVAIMGFRNKH